MELVNSRTIRWFPTDGPASLRKERTGLEHRIRRWVNSGRNPENPRFLSMRTRLLVVREKISILAEQARQEKRIKINDMNDIKELRRQRNRLYHQIYNLNKRGKDTTELKARMEELVAKIKELQEKGVNG